MRLLILTQKVDRDDPTLGFFHRWIIEFAKHCESVIVICLERGVNELPVNAKVLSLGKEAKQSRGRYVWNFYRHIFQERGNYDAVFVHMNQEYVLLGGVIWQLLGKSVFMWRNHATGNVLTRLAVLLSQKVFCTSPQSFTARFSKTSIMPVGIDTDLFSPSIDIRRKKNSVLCIGRISPVKKIEDIILAILALKKEDMTAWLTIVGNPTPNDQPYNEYLVKLVKDNNLFEVVRFEPAVSHENVPAYFLSHEVFINSTPAGSADKTIFEAMACGTIVVVRNRQMLNDLSKGGYVFDDVAGLSSILKSVMGMSNIEKNSLGEYLRSYVMDRHNLTTLSAQLIASMNNQSGLQK